MRSRRPGGPDPDKLTPLRMIFQQGCVDPLARGTVYNNDTSPGTNDPGGPFTALAPGTPTGNQQHTMYLQNYVAPVLGMPFNAQNIQTLAIFNTFTYGGIGGTQATTSGGSPQGPLISLHELGHSLGQMADEYPYSSRNVVKPCYTGGEPGSFHHTIRTPTQNMIDDQSQVVALDRRGEPVRRHDRAARGRQHLPVRRPRVRASTRSCAGSVSTGTRSDASTWCPDYRPP